MTHVQPLRPRVRPDWTTLNCRFCGSQLSAFGICPNATPEEALRQTAPVHCTRQALMYCKIQDTTRREVHRVLSAGGYHAQAL